MLEKLVRELPKNISGIILNGRHQIFAFADDIAITARNKEGIEEILEHLERGANEGGLIINEAKTKYSIISRNERRTSPYISINGHNFEVVRHFKYLGSIISSDNSINEEIKARISSATKCYATITNVLGSKELSWKTKICIYQTIIRPVVTYGSETWVLTKRQEIMLNTFERKILRRIYGPIEEEPNCWRIRRNEELRNMYKSPDLTGIIKGNQVRWLGHLLRMEEDRPTLRIFNAQNIGTRPRGRPKLRWIDSIIAILKQIKITKWREKARNRVEWRRIVMSARALQGP